MYKSHKNTMKKYFLSAFAVFAAIVAFAQGPRPGYKEKTVYKGMTLRSARLTSTLGTATDI